MEQPTEAGGPGSTPGADAFEERMMKLEAAKLEAQRQSEINSATNSIKTNLFLVSLYILVFLSVPVANPVFSMIVVSLIKSLVPVLTTIANFEKAKQMLTFSLLKEKIWGTLSPRTEADLFETI